MTSRRLPILLRAAVWWNRQACRWTRTVARKEIIFQLLNRAAWWNRKDVPRAIGRLQWGDEAFISTYSGALLSVDHRNFDVYADIINQDGQWEPHVMEVCRSLLREGDVFYDIGSNSGIFSLDFASAIQDLEIIAFEPQPLLVDHIRRSIKKNGFTNITVLEQLLGNENGEASLFLVGHSGMASLVPRERRARELRCSISTLDHLVGSGAISAPDIVKIDAEGAERAIFEGAQDVLRRHAPSIVFESNQNMRRFGYEADALFDALSSAADYQFFVIEDEGALSPARAPYPYGDFLALSPRHASRCPSAGHLAHLAA